MKFLSFFLITFFIIINISLKLLLVDQEAEMKSENEIHKRKKIKFDFFENRILFSLFTFFIKSFLS